MITDLSSHEPYMAHALELARRAWGHTHPNPMVGAVIVEQGEVVAEGWHHKAGEAHAEIQALRALNRQPSQDATMYVTLEPCSTHGTTGACTDAIQRAGIQCVVVGAPDPNPDHAGHGLEILREAGIDVISGVLAEECAELNLIFNHWIQQQTPFVAAKIATTLDGKFAASSGHSQWVTGELARADVMRWRRYFPSIAVSANTALADDPSLTSRMAGEIWCPRRFVFDRDLRTQRHIGELKLFTDKYSEQTVVVCSENVDTSAFDNAEITCWQLPECNGHIDLVAFRDRCAAENIYGVYIEPGPGLASALIEEQAIEYLFHYIAPKYMSDAQAAGIGRGRQTEHMDAAIQLKQVHHANFGPDHLVRGFLK